jgi:hypothetical protein
VLVTLEDVKQYLGIPGVTYPSVSVALTIDTTLKRITRASGSWTQDKVVQGSILTLAGFVNAENNVEIAVDSVVSATVIEYIGPSDMIDEIGTTTSFDQRDETSDTTYDDFLTEQIEVVSDAIEAYCGRKFLSAPYAQTFYFDDFNNYPKEIELYMYPVSSIDSVEEDEEAITDYRTNKPFGILTRKEGWFQTGDELVIQYTAGFTTLPSPIRQVVYNVVEERYNKKTSGVALNFGSDVQRVSIPGTISIDFDYTLTQNERTNAFGSILGNNLNVLDAYRSERVIVGSGSLKYVEDVP